MSCIAAVPSRRARVAFDIAPVASKNARVAYRFIAGALRLGSDRSRLGTGACVFSALPRELERSPSKLERFSFLLDARRRRLPAWRLFICPPRSYQSGRSSSVVQ